MPLFVKVFLPGQGELAMLRSSATGKRWLCSPSSTAASDGSSLAAALNKMVLIYSQPSIISSFPSFRLEDSSSFQKVLSNVGVSFWLHWEAELWKPTLPPRCLLGLAATFSQSPAPGDSDSYWSILVRVSHRRDAWFSTGLPDSYKPSKVRFFRIFCRGFCSLYLFSVMLLHSLGKRIWESVFDIVSHPLYENIFFFSNFVVWGCHSSLVTILMKLFHFKIFFFGLFLLLFRNFLLL